jgi:hypothetical protein
MESKKNENTKLSNEDKQNNIMLDTDITTIFA